MPGSAISLRAHRLPLAHSVYNHRSRSALSCDMSPQYPPDLSAPRLAPQRFRLRDVGGRGLAQGTACVQVSESLGLSGNIPGRLPTSESCPSAAAFVRSASEGPRAEDQSQPCVVLLRSISPMAS